MFDEGNNSFSKMVINGQATNMYLDNFCWIVVVRTVLRKNIQGAISTSSWMLFPNIINFMLTRVITT